MVRSRKIRRILARKEPSEAVGFSLCYPELSGIGLALASAYWAIAALAEGQPEDWCYAETCALGTALCWMLTMLK